MDRVIGHSYHGVYGLSFKQYCLRALARLNEDHYVCLLRDGRILYGI
jgi:hypothetical protein